MIKYRPLVEDSWAEDDEECVCPKYITFLIEKDRIILETQGVDYKKISFGLNRKIIENLYIMTNMERK